MKRAALSRREMLQLTGGAVGVLALGSAPVCGQVDAAAPALARGSAQVTPVFAEAGRRAQMAIGHWRESCKRRWAAIDRGVAGDEMQSLESLEIEAWHQCDDAMRRIFFRLPGTLGDSDLQLSFLPIWDEIDVLREEAFLRQPGSRVRYFRKQLLARIALEEDAENATVTRDDSVGRKKAVTL